MNRVFRRLFASELEFFFRLASPFLARRPSAPPLRRRESRGAPVRKSLPPRVLRRAPATLAAPGPGRELLLQAFRHRVVIIAATLSIVGHAGLLGMLGKINFFGEDRNGEDPPPIQIFVRVDRGPRAPEAPAPKVEKVPPAPSPPPAPPAPPPEPEPKLDRVPLAPPAKLEEDSPGEPGSPGTGQIARIEPEGRPGPPSILGVGSSPPPGDGRGNGGEGEGDGMGSRTRGKAGLLKRYGGSDETEDAVSKGLAWLAAHQDLDGGWSAANFNLHCHHFTQCLGKGLDEFDTGVTALCVLAFLGAGQAPGLPGPYGMTVERAIEKLAAGQRSDGCLGVRGDRYLYNHSIASFALCEAYSATRDVRWLKPAMASINFSASSQQAGGGWDYTDSPTGRCDLSITGWQAMAFRAALSAGFPIPEDTLRHLSAFLHDVSLPNGEALYASKGMGAGRRGISMTAVALLSRLYSGTQVNDRWVGIAADRLMSHPPDQELVRDWDTNYQSSYYWYYSTLCLFHVGGQRWEAWNHFIKKALLPGQSRTGHEKGSWEPDPNWLGSMGGRVFTTAVNVLTLEVYYRYPPLHAYKKDRGIR